MNRAERWTAIILIAVATMFIGQIAANTAPAPERPCIDLTYEGAVPCATTN